MLFVSATVRVESVHQAKIITQPRTLTLAAIGQTRARSILIGQIGFSFININVNIDGATEIIEIQRQTKKVCCM